MAQQRFTLIVNGQTHVIDADGQTPLLYILQNDLALRGARFGCGLAQCGSCSVLVDDREVRACITPLAAVAGRAITTLEGVAAWHARRRDLARVPDMHPVQQALLEAEAPQCGYCMNGIVMKSAELLDQNPQPTEEQIRAALAGHLCRCGTYPSILRAVQNAART
jgi:aerobic-type carbon monoxide dehydrogenase small subunit (CoxS/CutS family)